MYTGRFEAKDGIRKLYEASCSPEFQGITVNSDRNLQIVASVSSTEASVSSTGTGHPSGSASLFKTDCTIMNRRSGVKGTFKSNGREDFETKSNKILLLLEEEKRLAMNRVDIQYAQMDIGLLEKGIRFYEKLEGVALYKSEKECAQKKLEELRANLLLARSKLAAAEKERTNIQRNIKECREWLEEAGVQIKQVTPNRPESDTRPPIRSRWSMFRDY
jgi:hypothetical protein